MRLFHALPTIGFMGIVKTLAFNFRYLPFKQAIHLPVVLSSKVKVVNMGRGRLVLDDLGGASLVH